jgi:glycosyltransferase involved in cell wall biosynthesis
MIYIAYFIFGFSALQLLLAFVNLVFNQSFPKTKISSLPLVSILIPARNEEKNIGSLLTDLHKQDYQNLEIIVFNDESTDKTAEIVNDFIHRDSRIQMMNSTGLPIWWLGKNYACHAMALKAKGEYFLFLDADVRIGNEIIKNTIGLARKFNLGLISIFPMQIMKSIGEWISVPVMNYILLTLLPLVLVRKAGFPSLAAANGQFMLFEAKKYSENQPHEKMKANKVEDIEIARFYKRQKIKVACLLGDSSIRCRMYQAYNEAVNGFSKNVINFFGNSNLFAIIFWLLTSFGFVAVLFSISAKAMLIHLIIIFSTKILVSIASRQNVFYNLAWFIPQQVSLGIFIYTAIGNTLKKQYEWKGRNIS